MKIEHIPKEKLIVNHDILKLDHPLKTYLLINESNEVILGNSFIHLIDNCYCIRVKNSNILKISCYEFENEIVKENNKERIINIVNEINSYIRNYMNKTQDLDFELDLKELRTIEETEFIKPPAYNFKKHTKKKNEENDFNLFEESELI